MTLKDLARDCETLIYPYIITDDQRIANLKRVIPYVENQTTDIISLIKTNNHSELSDLLEKSLVQFDSEFSGVASDYEDPTKQFFPEKDDFSYLRALLFYPWNLLLKSMSQEEFDENEIREDLRYYRVFAHFVVSDLVFLLDNDQVYRAVFGKINDNLVKMGRGYGTD